jgi:leucyl-tRNA synthetase
MAEELWQRLGRTEPLTYHPFPTPDPAMLVSDTIEVPVQVNGKVRSKVTVVSTTTDDDIKALALADPKIVALLDGKTPRNVIVVPRKLINVVL